MTDETQPVGLMQRLTAVSIAALLALGVVSIVGAYAEAMTARLAERQELSERILALELRLKEEQDKTREKLAALGATPAGLVTMSDAQKASRPLAAACKSVLAAMSDATVECAIAEQPVTGVLTSYKASLTQTAAPQKLIAALDAIGENGGRVAAFDLATQAQALPTVSMTLEQYAAPRASAAP